MQKLQGEEGFHLFFESPLKRKRPARGTQTNSEVPDRRLLDERADDTAVLKRISPNMRVNVLAKIYLSLYRVE